MELYQLRTFIVVAEEGHQSRSPVRADATISECPDQAS